MVNMVQLKKNTHEMTKVIYTAPPTFKHKKTFLYLLCYHKMLKEKYLKIRTQ